MIRSKNRVIGIGLLSGLLILGAGQQALAQEGVNLARNDQQADIDVLRMYFSDENLVEVTTRTPLPLPKVAENVSIVTAEQIETMGVHTVDEVLAQLPGMIVFFQNGGFGDNGYYRTHGLGYQTPYHTLVLIDGVRINELAGGTALTNGIPLQIIKRIEMIKGPASSVWGASLGGVINIITKDTGTTVAPQVTMSASGGEANTQDYNTDIVAQVGPLSYYLYAGRQESDGLRDDHWFASNRFYGKVAAELGEQTQLILAIGSSDPEYLVGTNLNRNEKIIGSHAHSWGSFSLDSRLMTGVNLRVALQGTKMDWERKDFRLSNGDYLDDYTYVNETRGGEAILAVNRWSGHRVVLGAETQREELKGIFNFGGPTSVNPVYQEKRGVFINDSIDWRALTITPGIRHDYSSLLGEHTSPSLAAIYRLGDTTLLRLTYGRGFGQMPIQDFIWKTNIKAEHIKSLQGGVETTVMNMVRFKTTLFHHDIKNTYDPNSSINTLPTQRDGVEAELETQDLYGFTAFLNTTYVHERNRESGRNPPLDIDGTNDDITAVNLAFSYSYQDLFRTRLAGHYIWFDAWQSLAPLEHDYSPMLWDFTFGVMPKFFKTPGLTLFGTVHNIFNGTVYWSEENKNPGRWVEAGVSIQY
ncbi:MAG: hypothetical protein A2511_07625 [Deltaproteobacteria bacterium RIFOXYD12_FULL_50_9]|nr:MAG: hypothetical protein A2511_07625 [Deltaproteobacteria bacterium RIFOXYD12_FULL_50_9]